MSQNPIWSPNPKFGTGAPSGSPSNSAALTANQVYYDTSTTPWTPYVWKDAAWNQVGNITASNGAVHSSQPADPVAPASTAAFKMQGLAGTITPTKSGNVQVTISGNFISSTVTAGDGIIIQGSHGTGAAPANAGNLAGTQDGAVQKYANPATVTAADVLVPFSLTFLLTGLTLNTAYWLDLAAKSIATVSSGGVANVNIVAVEI